MLARWIATVAALLLACAQASPNVRTERVADLVNLADVTAPLGELAQPSKTASPARANLEELASGENPHVTHCHLWQKSFSAEKFTSGTTIWRWDSAPFGDTAANEQPTVGLPSFTLNLRFPGQQYDRETGTHYNYFRDYEAQTGRYVQSDPVGLFGGISTFNYVDASPLTAKDSFGLQARRPSGRNVWSPDPWRPIYGPQPLEPLPSRPGQSFTNLTFYEGTGGQCAACFEVILVAPIRGGTRSTHRGSANEFLLELISSNQTFASGIDARLGGSVAAHMIGRGGALRNPPGTEWHHHSGLSNVMWLLRRCDHRSEALRDFLHAYGRGGFANHYFVGPSR